MSKKILSTVLLFGTSIICLFLGLFVLSSPGDTEAKFFGVSLLICSIIAFVALLRLPRKQQQ